MNVGQCIAIGALWIYKRTVSPILHTLAGPFGGCRFHPTCSVYAMEAIRRHGLGRGLVVATRRICRCHPWGGCGDDPVPSVLNPNRNLTRPFRSLTLAESKIKNTIKRYWCDALMWKNSVLRKGTAR